MGLAVGLQVAVGLCDALNDAVAADCAALPPLRLSARSRLSSNVRPRSWLRLRLIGYTVGTRVRSLVTCLNLSSLRR